MAWLYEQQHAIEQVVDKPVPVTHATTADKF